MDSQWAYYADDGARIFVNCLSILPSSVQVISLLQTGVLLEYTEIHNTVDWEIFTLKINCMKNFHGVKFSQFRSICEFFLTVDSCNRDVCLERS